MRRRLLISILLILGMGLLGVAPLQAQEGSEGLSSEEVVARLAALQENVREIRVLYPEAVAEEGGTVLNQEKFDRALQLAEEVRAAFGQEENTPLFEAIQERSPFIADVLKAEASQLATAVLERRSVAEVLELIDKLLPDLNRAVIVAKSRVFPKGERILKTAEEIRQAVQRVIDLVDQAVDEYRRGNVERAAALANDAFFEFESSGLGPDSSQIDEELENEVESDITNFGPGAEEDPGLEQLIRRGAPIEQSEAQRQRIIAGLMKIQELLIATLPRARLGDVNGDGRLTITDALLIAQAALGLRAVDPEVADVNCDGRITIADALLVAQAALGLRELPEACPA